MATAAEPSPSNANQPVLNWRPRSASNPLREGKPTSILRTQYRQAVQPEQAAPQLQPAPLSLQPNISQPELNRTAPPVEDSLTPPVTPPNAVPRRDIFGLPPQVVEKKCPKPHEVLKKITDVGVDIRLPPQTDELPPPQICPLDDETFAWRNWPCLTYHWKAPALCHKPLYFEEVAAERYGHTFGVLQPFVAGAHFFGTLPLLPYKMGMESPWECMYSLGYYEPGSCAPYMIRPIPFNLRGALLQGGAYTGGVFLVP